MAIRSIIRRLCVLCTTSPQDVAIDAWPSERIVKWQRIVVACLDSRGSYFEILFKRGSRDYLLLRDRAETAVYSVQVDGPFLAPGDFRVVGRFVGCAAGDRLELYAYGEVVEEAA